jgi:DNA-binding transcriptional regulator YhcF (GntR family)
MEFYIDKNSSTPIASQIQEQIKLSVMMGVFRNGDTLPSIRDIEKQTGINRSQIHKAYLALRQSGLLVLTRGKGTVVAAAADSSNSIDESCRKLAEKIISKARQMGISPTAFARYLSRHALEHERNTPFIICVDTHEELAGETAAEISQLWQVPVIGVALQDLDAAISRHPGRVKILVSHLLCDSARAMLPRRKSDVIPVEVVGTEQTLKTIGKIKSNSSVLVIHVPQPSNRIEFIMRGLRELMDPRGIKATPCPVRNALHFRELVSESQYDYYFVGPAARGEVPLDMRNDPRVLQVHPQLDPASLEAARIRAGVII